MATRAKGNVRSWHRGVDWPGSELRLRTPPRRRRTGRRQPEVLAKGSLEPIGEPSIGQLGEPLL